MNHLTYVAGMSPNHRSNSNTTVVKHEYTSQASKKLGWFHVLKFLYDKMGCQIALDPKLFTRHHR